jgi:hypothetical protein
MISFTILGLSKSTEVIKGCLHDLFCLFKLAWGLIRMPQVFKWMSKKNIEPTLVSVVDLRSPNRKTPAGPAIAFLKKFGLRVANDNPALLERVGMDMVKLPHKILDLFL